MIKIVKTVCLFGVLTVITNTDLVATRNYERPTSDLDIIFSLQSYAENGALFDILNNNWKKSRKLIAFNKIFENFNPDVNALDPYGFPLLHRAIEKGSMPIIRLLIKKGANINAKNNINNNPTQISYTPLQWAILKGKNRMAGLFIENRASIEKRSSDGSNILHFAAMKGYSSIIRTALKKKTLKDKLIQKRNSDGNTALHLAAFYAKKGALKVLIRNGIDHTMKNQSGLTAEDILAFGCKNPALFKKIRINEKKLIECHAYLQLITDFFSTLKTMQESPSMFSCFNEDHITEAFDHFVKKDLIGVNVKKNSKIIKKILYLDKQRKFASIFMNWYTKQSSSPQPT